MKINLKFKNENLELKVSQGKVNNLHIKSGNIRKLKERH